MWHLETRYYLHPFFETRSVSKMVEMGRYRKSTPSQGVVCLRSVSHIQVKASETCRNAKLRNVSLAMRFEMLHRSLKGVVENVSRCEAE
jgi:hypothetical protein